MAEGQTKQTAKNAAHLGDAANQRGVALATLEASREIVEVGSPSSKTPGLHQPKRQPFQSLSMVPAS